MLTAAVPSAVSTKHGETSDGGRHWTTEYTAWKEMKRRCTSNPESRYFKDYVGRGIDVCPQWRDDFVRFLADVGRRPSSRHSLDRINNDRGYEPGNVRWATKSEQNRNTRVVKLHQDDVDRIRTMLAAGRRQRDVAKCFGIRQSTVSKINTGKKWA